MPELPEVETLRLGLNKYLVGHRIEAIEIRKAKIFRGEKKNAIGAKIKNVRRFGKLLVIDLSNGNSLAVHLKLTGQLIYRGPRLRHPSLSKKVAGGLPGKHTHVIFKLDRQGFLYYNDLRQFGWIQVMKTNQVEKEGFAAKLGPEPFKDLTLQKFKETLAKSKIAIKVLLMDQARIAGVGNIYANEALWAAKIHPKTPANSLSPKQMEELYKNLLETLKKGIKYQGASDVAFVTAEGEEGSSQEYFHVYSQEGELCSRCKKVKIKKFFLGGRGTYYCPYCQKA
jgi:formamidopyrimidine-DNA glycosylase